MKKNKLNFRHYSAVRLALRLSAIFLFASILMAVFAFLNSKEEIEKRAFRDLGELQGSLIAVDEAGDFDQLAIQVDVLARGARYGEGLLYLVDEAGRLIAGNALQMPVFEGRKNISIEQIKFPKQLDDEITLYFSIGTKLSGGYLILGRSNSEVEEIGEVILNAFLASFGVSLLLTFLLAGFSVRRVNQRIEIIEETLKTAAAGELQVRIEKLPKNKDDIDRIAENINAMLEKLEAAMDSLKQISGDMAHELKTPIQRLYQELETVAQIDGLSDAASSGITKALKEAASLTDIFQALLRISQLESGAQRQHFKVIHYNDLLENIIEIYEPVAEDAGHILTFQSASEKTSDIVGDFELLTQLFANLIENSITHCSAPSQIRLTIQETAKNVQVTLADNGPGIPQAQRERVFERLYRLEKSRTTPGTGLGLSLVKAIADLHNCDIELHDNNPGLKVVLSFQKPD